MSRTFYFQDDWGFGIGTCASALGHLTRTIAQDLQVCMWAYTCFVRGLAICSSVSTHRTQPRKSYSVCVS